MVSALSLLQPSNRFWSETKASVAPAMLSLRVDVAELQSHRAVRCYGFDEFGRLM